MELVIGSRQWSTWSLRAWLALRHLGILFHETVVPLRTALTQSRIAPLSPSGKVPVLIDGPHRIWDSLAICEYANERAGERGWPLDLHARAHARAVSAEMHAGFAALRATWPMEAASVGLSVPLTNEGQRDVERVLTLMTDCRDRYGSAGPWLFGTWTIADAMYAPVVLRFRSYGAELGVVASDYMATTLADPAMQEWLVGAESESIGR